MILTDQNNTNEKKKIYNNLKDVGKSKCIRGYDVVFMSETMRTFQTETR